MGMYTYFNIVCEIAPEYIDMVKYYQQHSEWPEPKPSFILAWEQFLETTGHCSIFKEENGPCKYYNYIGMGGMDGYWEGKLELNNSTLHVAGSEKNYNRELQYFVQQILILGLGGTITTCEITSDRDLNGGYSLHGPVSSYDDWYLREHDVCF